MLLLALPVCLSTHPVSPHHRRDSKAGPTDEASLSVAAASVSEAIRGRRDVLERANDTAAQRPSFRSRVEYQAWVDRLMQQLHTPSPLYSAMAAEGLTMQSKDALSALYSRALISPLLAVLHCQTPSVRAPPG